MPRDFGQLNVRFMLLLVAILVLAILVGNVITKLPPLAPGIAVAGIIICLITLIRTDFGLIVLIFSMLLSPELELAQLPSRAVVIRVDDILLAIVFFSWLAKLAIRKELGLLKRTPLNLPIAIYVAACLLFTARGIVVGKVSPIASSFYLIKYIEYFMLYFMFSNNIRSQKQMRIFIAAFLITGAIVCIYSFTRIGTMARVSTPFEGPGGEANTLAGYLLLLFAITVGLFLYNSSPTRGIPLGALACFIIPSFLFSLSRGGYMGFICMYLTLMILTRRKKLLLISIFALTIFLGPLILPTRVINRITSTFIPGREYEIFGGRIALDDSASWRVEVWKDIFKQWQERPIFGHGVTGVGLADSQYARILGELGVVGFLIFIWLLVTIFRSALQIFRTSRDDYFKGLALGFLAGFVGLLVQSFTGNIFIIVRIMEPFWFLAAAVMMIPTCEGFKEQSD